MLSLLQEAEVAKRSLHHKLLLLQGSAEPFCGLVSIKPAVPFETGLPGRGRDHLLNRSAQLLSLGIGGLPLAHQATPGAEDKSNALLFPRRDIKAGETLER